MEKTFSEEDIKSLTPREWFNSRIVEKAEIDLLYVIIGALDEFWGGYNLHNEVVRNFSQEESETALVFKRICETWLLKNDLPNDVELQLHEQGSSTIISKNICAELKKHYSKPLNGSKCFLMPDEHNLFRLENKNEEYSYRQYSFLIGVVMVARANDKPLLTVCGERKFEATLKFIRNFDCFGGTELTVKYLFRHSPGCSQILLEEDNLLWEITNNFTRAHSGLK